jgi:hypothetical protein
MTGHWGYVMVVAAMAASCASFEAAPASPPDTDAGIPSGAGVHPYVAAVLQDKPAFYFRLEERAGAVAINSAPTGVAGAYEGTVVLGAQGAFRASQAIERDGTPGRVKVTGADFSGPFSIELWYRQPVSDVDADRFRFLAATNQGTELARDGVYLFIHPKLGLSFERLVAGTYVNGVRAAIPSLSTFHHVVATYGSGMCRLYIDGASVGSAVDTRLANASAAPLWFGDFGPAPIYPTFVPFIGSIDEIAVYADALDPARIEAHFRAANRP